MKPPGPQSVSLDLRCQINHKPADQGPRPACLAIATTAAHDYLAAAKGDDNRAAESLWWAATRIEGHTGGLSLQSVGKALIDTGQPSELLWPYPSQLLTTDPEEPPAGCGNPPWRTAVLMEVARDWTSVEPEIEKSLIAGTPVIVILAVTDAFDSPEAGRIASPPKKAPSRGNHAVLAVGLEEIEGHGRHLIVRNSWGPKWGVNGDAFLPLSYLATHGIKAAVLGDV